MIGLAFHAGGFDDEIRIQRRTKTRKGTGVTEVWADVETRYARVVPLDFEARARYAQTYPDARYRIIFRDRVDLTMGDYRLWWEGTGKVLIPQGPEFDPEGSSGSFTVVMAADRPEEKT